MFRNLCTVLVSSKRLSIPYNEIKGVSTDDHKICPPCMVILIVRMYRAVEYVFFLAAKENISLEHYHPDLSVPRGLKLFHYSRSPSCDVMSGWT